MKHIIRLLPVLFVLAFYSCKTTATLPIVEEEKIEDTLWVLETMRKKQMKYSDEQDRISIRFNTESGMVNGRSGCNQYFGKFALQGKNLTFTDNIGSTRMACFQELMTLENTYLNILKTVNKYQIADGKLHLYQNEQVVLTFSPEIEVK